MNSGKDWFNHAYENRRNGENAERQAAVNARRLARTEKAQYRLPVFIPLRWDLPAISPIAPISVSTPNNINYDVLIWGLISDSPDREIRFKSSSNEINPSVLGQNVSLRLTLGDIAGATKDSADTVPSGIFPVTSPFILKAGSQLTIEMYKETTDNAEVSNLVLVGTRVFREKQTSQFAQYDDTEALKQFIASREVPRPFWLKHEVVFNANGEARNVTTPTIDEPLIIRGVKSTLKYSTIESVKFAMGMEWNIGDCPSWALFEAPNGKEKFFMFKEPLFLPRKSEIQVQLKNTIAGTNYIDDNGSITWLCETL